MHTMKNCWLRGMMLLVATTLALLLAPQVRAATVYHQPPDPAGGQYKSAWYAPDGLDDDQYVWDSFTLPSNTAITEVRWRGAYTNYLSGAGKAPVYDFTVSIYGSAAANTEPDVSHPPLVKYHTSSNAGEAPAGTFGGVIMYDYHFTLPSPFQAVAGTKYWVQIEAYQGLTPTYHWPPDWSIAKGTGGNGSHFRRVGGSGGSFAFISGDCAFTLLTSDGPTWTINASASPDDAGSVQGAGIYPADSQVTLVASASTGYGFVNWTEGSTQVSTSAKYKFTATKDRTLVANFVPAYVVTTGSSPTYGGITTGDGTFNQGASVTVSAVANPGFDFAGWTYYGMPVSSLPVYTFTADSDLVLTAEFVHTPLSTTFTFDDAPPYTLLPISLVSDGLGAYFWATGSGFSIQHANALGFTPAGFAGNCIYPNSVFAADLIADFSEPLTFFSIMYCVQELGCDDSARMRVTAFLGGVQVGTATTTAPVPGTWPVGTLSISVPGGFDRAVVHYDGHPPTCQDYGVIFLADNMTVTMQCAPLSVAAQPFDAGTCPDGGVSFSVGASGPGTPAYQWQRETAQGSGVFVNLADGSTAPWDGGATGVGGVVYGSSTDTLSIMADSANGLRLSTEHAVHYRCVLTNPCSGVTSDAARLTVCVADFDCSGFVDTDDFDSFVLAFEAGGDNADVDGSGFVDTDDFDFLVHAFEAGC